MVPVFLDPQSLDPLATEEIEMLGDLNDAGEERIQFLEARGFDEVTERYEHANRRFRSI